MVKIGQFDRAALNRYPTPAYRGVLPYWRCEYCRRKNSQKSVYCPGCGRPKAQYVGGVRVF